MEIIYVLNQQPVLLVLILLLFGLAVGSFLNVVIYRIPVMMERDERRFCAELMECESGVDDSTFNLAVPNSSCPNCGHEIRPWENIPVLSYLFLRGRCSGCNQGISLRYPSIELLSGILAVVLGVKFGAAGMPLLGALLFTWALLALTMIDFDTMLLPDMITLPLLWLGLLFNLYEVFVPLQDAVIGAIGGYLSLWSVYWLFKLSTGKEGMGFGDFKLLAALGAWLGWQSLLMIILLSSAVGAVLGMALMYLNRHGRDVPMPFGPFLAIAGWIAMVWGEELMAWYWSFAGGPAA